MIQLTLRFAKLCLVLILSLLLGSCMNKTFEIKGLTPVSGSGNILIEKREISQNFDKITVSNSIDVELVQAPNYEITVEADDNIIPYILTEINGSTLNIRFDGIFVSNVKKTKVYVKMPKITDLRASATSEIETKTPIKSDDLVLKSNSTADIKLAQVTANSIIAEASSSSDIKIETVYTAEFKGQTSSTAEIEIDYIEADKISLTTSSSSEIELKGKALDLYADTSSASKIEAKELLVNNVIANASSSSSIKINPIVSLKAKASSTADIYYYNNPKTIEKKTSSAGSVKKKK